MIGFFSSGALSCFYKHMCKRAPQRAWVRESHFPIHMLLICRGRNCTKLRSTYNLKHRRVCLVKYLSSLFRRVPFIPSSCLMLCFCTSHQKLSDAKKLGLWPSLLDVFSVIEASKMESETIFASNLFAAVSVSAAVLMFLSYAILPAPKTSYSKTIAFVKL